MYVIEVQTRGRVGKYTVSMWHKVRRSDGHVYVWTDEMAAMRNASMCYPSSTGVKVRVREVAALHPELPLAQMG